MVKMIIFISYDNTWLKRTTQSQNYAEPERNQIFSHTILSHFFPPENSLFICLPLEKALFDFTQFNLLIFPTCNRASWSEFRINSFIHFVVIRRFLNSFTNRSMHEFIFDLIHFFDVSFKLKRFIQIETFHFSRTFI